MTGPDTGVGDLAPAVVGQEQVLLPAARVQAPVGMGQDLVRSISEAAAAVRFVDATGSGGADISVTALTALVCTGDTEAAAMQAAADQNREITPRMRVISLAWATVPGPADGTWQWAVTMTVGLPRPQDRRVRRGAPPRACSADTGHPPMGG